MSPDSDLEFKERFKEDVLIGLSSRRRKWLPAKYLYDETGSQLFERITELPEYYPTRTEASILQQLGPRLPQILEHDITLVELGSGSSLKTKILIDHLIEAQETLHYIPVDISPTILEQSASELRKRYEHLRVYPLTATYEAGLKTARTLVEANREMPNHRLGLFLGSSIGNLRPHIAIAFLEQLREGIDEDDRLLIGFDLQKNAEILTNAYNDSEGVTAAFNLNLLHRINRELGGDFDIDQFEHRAFYNENRHRIEMHLVSRKDQVVRIEALERREPSFHFDEDESIHTESSYKYTEDIIRHFAFESGFAVKELFTDDDRWFALALFQPE